MCDKKEAQVFWDWFAANHFKFLFVHEVEENIKNKMLDELLEKLHQFNHCLFFEIGSCRTGELMELVITAEGDVEHFPAVETLIDAAPKLKDWRFIKFKQPNCQSFTINFRGKDFNPEEVIFMPLSSEEDDDSVAIQVCYADYRAYEREIYLNGTYIMLDALLGEKSTALDIDYLEVMSIPSNISEYYYLDLIELPSYIKEKKYNALNN